MKPERKAIVVGRGQVGKHLANFINDHFPTLWWCDDIETLDAQRLSHLGPLAVVNAAGKTDLQWCEENAREAFRCNVSAPLGLLRACQFNHVPLIHLSSGCIWDGPYIRGLGFKPEDRPTPASYYAWTKAACDSMMMAEARVGLNILRPRQVFSGVWTPRNLLVKLLNYEKLLATPNSMTSLKTIADTVLILLRNPGWTRTWNVYDRGIITPLRVGEMLAEAGLRDVPEEISKDELNSWHKPRRVDTVLHDRWFEHVVNPPSVEDTLKEAINALVASRTLPSLLGHQQVVVTQPTSLVNGTAGSMVGAAG